MSDSFSVTSYAPPEYDSSDMSPPFVAENRPVISASDRSEEIAPVELSYDRIAISPSLATENSDSRFADVTFVNVNTPFAYVRSPKPVPVVAAEKCACVSAADGPVYENSPDTSSYENEPSPPLSTADSSPRISPDVTVSNSNAPVDESYVSEP